MPAVVEGGKAHLVKTCQQCNPLGTHPHRMLLREEVTQQGSTEPQLCGDRLLLAEEAGVFTREVHTRPLYLPRGLPSLGDQRLRDHSTRAGLPAGWGSSVSLPLHTTAYLLHPPMGRWVRKGVPNSAITCVQLCVCVTLP